MKTERIHISSVLVYSTQSTCLICLPWSLLLWIKKKHTQLGKVRSLLTINHPLISLFHCPHLPWGTCWEFDFYYSRSSRNFLLVTLLFYYYILLITFRVFYFVLFCFIIEVYFTCGEVYEILRIQLSEFVHMYNHYTNNNLKLFTPQKAPSCSFQVNIPSCKGSHSSHFCHHRLALPKVISNS